MARSTTYRIWIAGNYDDAVRAVREWCDRRGDCYAVSPCEYVFSGGLESGVCITRINYGKFPETEDNLRSRVEEFLAHMAERLFQKSYSIETPSETIHITRPGPWDLGG